MFNHKAGAELTTHFVATVHYEVWALPAAEKIEVTLPLAEVDVFVLKHAESDQGIGGAAPTVVNRAAKFERFGVPRRHAKAGGALHAAAGSKTVEVKTGEVRARIKSDVQRIGAGLRDKFAAAGPIEQRCRAAAYVKCPRACNRDDTIQDD